MHHALPSSWQAEAKKALEAKAGQLEEVAAAHAAALEAKDRDLAAVAEAIVRLRQCLPALDRPGRPAAVGASALCPPPSPKPHPPLCPAPASASEQEELQTKLAAKTEEAQETAEQLRKLQEETGSAQVRAARPGAGAADALWDTACPAPGQVVPS